MADEEREEQEVGLKTREGAEQAAALDSITDHREERELKTADTKRIQQAMAALAAQQHAARELQRQKDRELAAVKISPEDVDLIATEFEMDKKLAERSLREGKGDVRAAIESLLTP